MHAPAWVVQQQQLLLQPLGPGSAKWLHAPLAHSLGHVEALHMHMRYFTVACSVYKQNQRSVSRVGACDGKVSAAYCWASFSCGACDRTQLQLQLCRPAGSYMCIGDVDAWGRMTSKGLSIRVSLATPA